MWSDICLNFAISWAKICPVFSRKTRGRQQLCLAALPSWEYWISVIWGTGFCIAHWLPSGLQIKHMSLASVQWVTGLWFFNILGYSQQIIFSKNNGILFYCSHDLNLCGIAIEVNRTFSWVRFAGYSIIKIWQLIVLFMLLHLMNKYISLNIRLSFVYTL